MCEHYIGLCTDFPDWSIAAVGSESLVKIGYEYGHSVTGKELTVDLNLYEDKSTTRQHRPSEGNCGSVS